LEYGLAALLSRGQVIVRQAVTIWTVGQRVNECDQVGELLGIEALGAEEILFGARPAFGGHIRVAAVPFEWLGSGQILQRAIVDDIFAESIRLKVPLETVNGRVNVAIGTAKSSLERKFCGVEQAFAATQGVDLL